MTGWVANSRILRRMRTAPIGDPHTYRWVHVRNEEESERNRLAARWLHKEYFIFLFVSRLHHTSQRKAVIREGGEDEGKLDVEKSFSVCVNVHVLLWVRKSGRNRNWSIHRNGAVTAGYYWQGGGEKKLHQQPQKKKGGGGGSRDASHCARSASDLEPGLLRREASRRRRRFSLPNEGRRPCWTSLYNFLGTK